MRKRQTKEQAAEARAEYHELAAQASKIANEYRFKNLFGGDSTNG